MAKSGRSIGTVHFQLVLSRPSRPFFTAILTPPEATIVMTWKPDVWLMVPSFHCNFNPTQGCHDDDKSDLWPLLLKIRTQNSPLPLIQQPHRLLTLLPNESIRIAPKHNPHRHTPPLPHTRPREDLHNNL